MTSHVVRLTKDYWLGVYEVTQTQWFNLMETWPSYFTNLADRAYRPVENVTFAQVRGNWNIARFSSPATSFMGVFASCSGLSADVPTEAQIEYAMRAGDSENWYKNANSNDKLVSHARVQNNSGGYTYNSNESQDLHNITIATGGTAAVGSFAANDWGFYDMCGNVWEMCYDGAGYADHTGPGPGETGPVCERAHARGVGSREAGLGGQPAPRRLPGAGIPAVRRPGL